MKGRVTQVGDFDFSGWATRNDLKCSDGRTIRRDAFKDCQDYRAGASKQLEQQFRHNL